MTTISAPATLGDVLKHEYSLDYCRDVITLKASSGYALGSVLGCKAADGIYDLSPATGDTGTEAACAVLLEAVPAGSTSGLALVRGPAIVAESALVFTAGVNTEVLKKAKHHQLAECGIVVRSAL